MKTKRKKYLQKLIASVRKDFIEPQKKIVDGDITYPLEVLDIDLLCTVVEEELLNL